MLIYIEYSCHVFIQLKHIQAKTKMIFENGKVHLTDILIDWIPKASREKVIAAFLDENIELQMTDRYIEERNLFLLLISGGKKFEKYWKLLRIFHSFNSEMAFEKNRGALCLIVQWLRRNKQLFIHETTLFFSPKNYLQKLNLFFNEVSIWELYMYSPDQTHISCFCLPILSQFNSNAHNDIEWLF